MSTSHRIVLFRMLGSPTEPLSTSRSVSSLGENAYRFKHVSCSLRVEELGEKDFNFHELLRSFLHRTPSKATEKRMTFHENFNEQMCV